MNAAAGAGSAAKIGASRCGAELREARERLGWDLGEVAAALRIRQAYLAAIEEGRLSALPGRAYALGFLRTYASALGLDADDVARRFRLESTDIDRRPDLSFPAPVPERGVPTTAAILIGLVVTIAAYGAWYRFSARDVTPTHSVPPVPAQLLPQHRPVPVSPQVASVMPATPAVPPSDPAGASTHPAGAGPSRAAGDRTDGTGATPVAPSPSPSRNPTAPGAAPMPGSSAAAPGVPATSTAPTPVAPSSNATSGPSAGTVLVASAPSWVQVRTADGKIIYDHILHAGDTWTVPDGQSGLLLTTGNAGGVAISRNGVAGPVLGRQGAVLRRIPLDGSAAGTASPTSSTPSAVTAAPSAPTETAATPQAVAPAHRRANKPAAPSDDDSADRLNAGQLGDKRDDAH